MNTTTVAHASIAVHTPAGLDSTAWLLALHAETKMLRTAQPALNNRLTSALHLASTGAVSHDAEGRWQVESRTTPGVFWQVDGSCKCPDAEHHAPDGLCAHRLAVGLHKRALKAVQASGTPPAAEPVREEHEQPAAAVSALPEAAFSITLKGTMGGHDALLTARGQSWEEFQANVQRLRGLLDAASAASPHESPPPPQETPTCPTHGPMKASTKAPGSWYCTKKLYDGSYCKSRWPEG